MLDNEDDMPIGQRLKLMTIMDVTPGRTQNPEHGEQIGIVLLASKNEMEQPIMFRLPDVKRLAVGCLMVLAHHDDPVATEIVLQHVDQNGDTAQFRQPVVAVPDEGVHDPTGTVPDHLPRTGLNLVASFHDKELKAISIAIIGGYWSGTRSTKGPTRGSPQ